MALESTTSVQGQIQKKKFKEKLSTATSRLSTGGGGAGQPSMPPQGSGQNEGQHTIPSPADISVNPGFETSDIDGHGFSKKS